MGKRDLCFHAFLAISGVFPRLQLPGQPGEQLAGRAGSAGRSSLLPAGPRLPKYKLGGNAELCRLALEVWRVV